MEAFVRFSILVTMISILIAQRTFDIDSESWTLWQRPKHIIILAILMIGVLLSIPAFYLFPMLFKPTWLQR